MGVDALECEGCGAPLKVAGAGRTVSCTYCDRDLLITDRGAREQAATGASSLNDELLDGYTGRDVGDGRRHGVAAMAERDWKAWEVGLWPVSGRASSTYGGSWSPDAIVGAPRVYPRSGDIPGAWAPKGRTSRVEWVEAGYDPEAPPVRAIRVFETCQPGCTFAVTARGTDGGDEELLWQARSTHRHDEAQVLEITLAAPRRLRCLRVYVDNAVGEKWSEIDTIGLVATGPVPERMRRRPSPSSGNPKLLAVGCIAAFLAALGAIVAANWSGAPKADIPTPPERVEGVAQTLQEALFGEPTAWAWSVAGRSSEYSADANSARRILGAPDVFPAYGDRPDAWAPDEADSGPEWITVAFEPAVPANAVLVVVTCGAGAVVRIDDLTDPARPVQLWGGRTASAEGTRILRLGLPEPRTIGALRVVLDTRLVEGWNEIDAVGLVEPR